MLVPPVAQGGTGDRPVGDPVARAQQTTTGAAAATTTLWPLAPAQPNQVPNQQAHGIPPLAATPAPAHSQGANRYGLYSLFPGGGGGSYVAATPATPGQPTPARAYHATTHKVSESVFSAAVGVGVGGYTWGAPTPPPGSPYSPVPVTQLELLAKNLANLAPAAAAAAAGQQALSLQGVGVNVAGSLHHAQHTQHTQHTLNLTGLHHLHHGGLHQNAFSPQLSLVTGGAPTLTINSFSSPNSANGVVPTTGVLLQEYQPPIGATAATGCNVTVNSAGSSCLTNTSSTTSGMLVHGGGAVQAAAVQATVAAATATKKREAFLPSQGQPVKLENKSTRTSCLCRNSNGKTKVVHSDVGCSRTLPVASSWNGQDVGNAGANNSGASLTVKREPLASVPCQVAEVSTSLHATTTSVKIEPVPPKSENGIAVSNAAAGGIPVGIAVARQRLQHQETSTSMRNVSLSHHTSHHATSYHHFQPDSLGSSTAMAVGGTTLVHCGGPGGEDRAAHLAAIPSGALAPSLSLNSSLNSNLNSTLGSIGGAPAADAAATAWPPTLWQYPAAAAAAMPTEPLGFPQMGSGLQGGLQLVRDPSGHVILIHAAEQMQQAVVWPNYPNHNGNIAPPPLLLPPPPPSIQLLSDIGGARLVLTENKRKQQSALPIVKIEAECSNSPTTIITSSTESSKTALQTMTSMTGALVPDAALVTTLHYYPPAPALVQISQAEPATHCRSQATSPVSYLTPPPEVPASTIRAIEPPSFGVQDASNQTDAPEDTEDQKQEPLVKQEQNPSPCQIASQSNPGNFEIAAPPPPTERICNVVRITTTTTTVNPTVCGIVAKVDKAENTIINMADCAKYAAKDGRAIVRAIEHDAPRTDEEICRDDKTASVCGSRGSRIGARIIEITEENCDSFHENLEFFARRRDISMEQRERRDSYPNDEEDVAQEPKIHEKIEVESKTIDASENVEIHRQTCAKTSEPPIFNGSRANTIDSTESSRINCESCDKSVAKDISNSEVRPQIMVKSFDMPNIDCDDQEIVQQVVVKQEADESCYEVCYESSRCEPTSTSERPRLPSCEKFSPEATKRHAMEKSHHPGIENVVEKLKKNAAALQEAAALPAAQKFDESIERSNVESVKSRRHSETIPKKLHFLRSCQNSLEGGVDVEVSSSSQSTTSERHIQDQSGQYSSIKDDKHLNDGSRSCNISGETCLLGDNNNDSRSNNNNIKALKDDKKLLAKSEKKNLVCEVTAYVKPKTVWRCEVQPIEKPQTACKPEDASSETKSRIQSQQKPAIDLSGLELLSNSIEQLEQRVGQPEQSQPDTEPVEKPSVRGKLMSQQSESNNNNVGSPLGLLCALAEQIMEVGDKAPRKLNLESSEEISQAGRLLLNLGRGPDYPEQDGSKRKYPESDDSHHSKRSKLDDCGEQTSKNASSPNRYDEIIEDRTGRQQEEILRKRSKEVSKDVAKDRTTETMRKQQEEALPKSKESIKCGVSLAKGKITEAAGRQQEGVPLKLKDIKRALDFSEVEINSANKRVTSLEDQALDRDCYSNQRGAKRIKDLQVSPNETSVNSQNNAVHNDKIGKENDFSEGEVFESKILPDQPASCEIDNRKMSVEDRDTHDYKNARTKLETKKFVAKKGNCENDDDDWPNMNATELDMRVRMADIQRQYREKQKELSKLIPKKDEKKSFSRPRKKSHSSTSSEHGILSSPPLALDPVNSPLQKSPSRSSESLDGAPPPLASAVLAMPRCNVNLVKLGEPRSHIKLLDSIPSIPISVPPVSSPVPGSSKAAPEDDEKSTGTLGYDTSSPAPTVASLSSASKKRKVGRPRKLTCTSGNVRHLTETIVAKKPKSKSSLVGYVLSSKSRHLQTKQCINSRTGYTPLPFKSGVSLPKTQSKVQKVTKAKAKPAKQTPLHNKNVISSIIAEKAKLSQEMKLEKHGSKVKPKLKAEVKVKNWEDDENDTVPSENVPPEEPVIQKLVEETPMESSMESPVEQPSEKEPERSRHDKSKKKKRKSSSSQSPSHDRKESKRRRSLECRQCAKAAAVAAARTTETIITKCKLTAAHLTIDQLRVLMAIGGLFYAGRLSAVQAPDVYAITLDGERGNRPHIHSREEILRDAIVEVCPTTTKELPPGTRLCAYWSQQYRCLYPGTSVEPIVPDPVHDEKYVTVEFDDGDSGSIILDDIRLLQPNYPLVEYDPNPLLSLGKRRRQMSSSEDKRSASNPAVSTNVAVAGSNNFAVCSNVGESTMNTNGECANEAEIETNVETSSTSGTEYRRRKHMKKIKKKRLLETQEGKKKHRKHRSHKEHRKHKHRKHRKHKHRHHSSFGDTSSVSNWETSQEQRNEEEAIADLPSTNFPAVEETRGLSEEDDETEGSLLTIQEDDEAQVESEEPDEPTQKDDLVFEIVSVRPSEPVIQQAQVESEEPSEPSDPSDPSDPVQEDEEAQMDFEESSEDVQATDEQSEEPSPEPTPKKMRSKVASTNRTQRGNMSKIARRISKTGRVSKISRASKMNRVTKNRATTRNASSMVPASTSCANANRASKNRATVQTNPSAPSNPVETPSPIARMLPNKRHWKWASGSRVSGGNQYFTAIRRGRETINIGDSVLFYSYRKPHEKPYIGKIVSLWLNQKLEMRVRSQWFYRPEELQQPCILNPPGGLFESKHSDSNDVQTISHKVMVLPLEDYNRILQASQRHQKGYEDNDPYYYYAGFYTHPTVTYAPGVTAVLQE